MKISKKRTVQVMVFAIALLLVLALSIGITGAWYQAKRQASGTVIMDQGIIIDYKGFDQATDGIWTKDKATTFLLFTETDAQPGENIAVNASSIRANADSVDFYARVKLEYKFYNGDVEVTTLANPSDLITTSESFFGANWVKSQNNDGWFYYGAGTTLSKLTPSDQESAFVALFADGAKFIIEGANFVGADEGEGGGFVVGDTSINKIEVTLTLETLQGSADAAGEGWSITPIPVVENFSSNKLINDETSEELNPETATLEEGTTYRVVDTNGNGYKFTITNSAASGQTQTMGAEISVIDGTAVVTGYTGEPTDLEIPSYIWSNWKYYKVKSIGDFAFVDTSDEENPVGCPSLTSIKIPNSVTSIGIGAFGFCSNLVTISIGDGVTSIGESAFYSCSGLTLIIIPDSVTNLGQYAFLECTSLTSVTIGNGVTSMGYGVFVGCPNLTEVIIKNGVTSIGNSAFAESGLTSVIIPDSVTSIGDGAFSGCSGLTSITIGNGVTSMGYGAFRGCTNLTEVIIKNGVTEIGEFAFDGCSGLTSVIIPDSVTSFGGKAFKDCSGLESITVADGNTKYHSAGNCLIETANKTLIAGCKTSVIPNDGSVTSIGYYAFEGCSGLTSITIPDSVTSIREMAFYGCSGLISITIPDSVTNISQNTFSCCSSLKSVLLGNQITRIYSRCFQYCSALETVVIKGEIISIGDDAFEGCGALTTILINSTTTPTGFTKVDDTLYNEQGVEDVNGTYYKYTLSQN